jgi:hypothetical protein
MLPGSGKGELSANPSRIRPSPPRRSNQPHSEIRDNDSIHSVGCGLSRGHRGNRGPQNIRPQGSRATLPCLPLRFRFYSFCTAVSRCVFRLALTIRTYSNNYSSIVEYINNYKTTQETVLQRLREPAPGRIQLLTGPRQVGKTTLLLEIAEQFGDAAIYAAGDDPDAALPGFWERRWAMAESRAHHRAVILLLDEIHHLADWAKRLKGYWDRLRRLRIPVHVVATGSSALHVGTGSRETMAGNFDAQALKGLFEFCRRNPKFTPLVVGGEDAKKTAERHKIPAITWKQFLLTGPPSS